jgi:sugar lactone lactonase YvrE
VYSFVRDLGGVLVYDRDGELLSAWGRDLFTMPHSLKVVGDAVFCVDCGDHSVRKLALDGRLLQVITAGFDGCTDVAVGPDGHIFVADGYGNSNVHRFSPDGEWQHTWGSQGSEAGQFRIPHAIHIDRQGRVLVADRENDRIQVFDVDGRFADEWADVRRPASIAEDADGILYVAEMGWRVGEISPLRGEIHVAEPSRLTILAPDGRLAGRVPQQADSGEPQAFVAAHGVAVDAAGNVYVAEVAATIGRLEPGAWPQIQKLHAVSGGSKKDADALSARALPTA